MLGDIVKYKFNYLNMTQTLNPVTPVFKPIGLDQAGNEISLPTFIKYDKVGKTFTVSTVDFQDIGKYTFGLCIAYQEYSYYSVTCR